MFKKLATFTLILAAANTMAATITPTQIQAIAVSAVGAATKNTVSITNYNPSTTTTTTDSYTLDNYTTAKSTSGTYVSGANVLQWQKDVSGAISSAWVGEVQTINNLVTATTTAMTTYNNAHHTDLTVTAAYGQTDGAVVQTAITNLTTEVNRVYPIYQTTIGLKFEPVANGSLDAVTGQLANNQWGAKNVAYYAAGDTYKADFQASARLADAVSSTAGTYNSISFNNTITTVYGSILPIIAGTGTGGECPKYGNMVAANASNSPQSCWGLQGGATGPFGSTGGYWLAPSNGFVQSGSGTIMGNNFGPLGSVTNGNSWSWTSSGSYWTNNLNNHSTGGLFNPGTFDMFGDGDSF